MESLEVLNKRLMTIEDLLRELTQRISPEEKGKQGGIERRQLRGRPPRSPR
jgi:hypothetical protein